MVFPQGTEESVGTVSRTQRMVSDAGSSSESIVAGVRPFFEVPDLFQQALALHRQNHFSEAETLYRQILTIEPSHPGALHFLGMVAFAQHRLTEAVDLIERSLRLCDCKAAYFNNYGAVLKELRRYSEAQKAFEQAIALDPDFPDALANLGILLVLQGPPYHLAEHYLLAALHLRPDHAGLLQNLSEIRLIKGDLAEISCNSLDIGKETIDYKEVARKMDTPLKIKVLQYMYGDFEYFGWSEKINRGYCEQHGYDYVLRRDEPRRDRHIIWHKISVALEEFSNCDYLLFVDADAVFYCHELRIEDELIPLLGDRSVLMPLDCGSESIRWSKNPNAGVFLIKSGNDSLEFMTDWNNATSIDSETRWRWPLEQLALWRHLMPRYKDRIVVVEDYYRVHGLYGYFIRHFMSMSDAKRSEEMKKIHQRLTHSMRTI